MHGAKVLFKVTVKSKLTILTCLWNAAVFIINYFSVHIIIFLIKYVLSESKT